MRFSLFTTLACLAVSHAAEYHRIFDLWSFDVGKGKNADWMDVIADNTPFSSLSIPGTHDSMTYHIGNGLLQTQNAFLAEQLTGGIRYIDITCKYKDSDILVYHGLAKTGHRLRAVLETIFSFLKQHPRETVILRIQRGGRVANLQNFFKYMDQILLPGTEIGDCATDFIYTPSAGTFSKAPSLGELRGKVLILEDFKTEGPRRYGLPWNEDTVTSYSQKLSAGGLFIEPQWADVKSHLSEDPSPDSNKLRITHTTASFGVSPIKVAANNGRKTGMNESLGQYLREPEAKCFGIVAMDFPGRLLVHNILELNKKYRVPEDASAPPAIPDRDTW
ncbi:1-phosphatidylinositol phosphodiesterase [Ceratocystis platani]|uniref:1-phosphatidylinositol phosphodiesterase n=1 Tax=Ceratocystis fimbriata f. sp. platani TaxID=88771 RepID=A0A0F8CNX8_CERFI|nr:1-phosphatidylinositol phosphodiesterase [Ceratocystis platani]